MPDIRNPADRDCNSYDCSPRELLVIYVSMLLLKRIRLEVGLEAEIDYIDKYITNIEGNYPEVYPEIKNILKVVDVNKIYRDSRT